MDGNYFFSQKSEVIAWDTITYWLTDTTAAYADTLALVLADTDTAGIARLRTPETAILKKK